MPLARPTRVALDADQIALAKQFPDRWLPAAFKIAPEDTTKADVVTLIPTPIQQLALGHILNPMHRYNYVIKHRQAKLSTLCCGVLLNKVMYSPAKKGLLIGNDEKTAKVLFDRIKFAYKNMPPQIRIDLEVENAENIRWPTHNEIRVITGGGKTPAIGNSPDLYVITEFGEYEAQTIFNKHFFPAVMKRPGAWGVIETTPGKHGTTSHDMWLRTLNSEGFMSGLFLAWWKDETCTAPVPEGFRPDQEELKMLEKYPGMTYGHLMFRRRTLRVFSRTETSSFHRSTRTARQTGGSLATEGPRCRKKRSRSSFRPPERSKTTKKPSIFRQSREKSTSLRWIRTAMGPLATRQRSRCGPGGRNERFGPSTVAKIQDFWPIEPAKSRNGTTTPS